MPIVHTLYKTRGGFAIGSVKFRYPKQAQEYARKMSHNCEEVTIQAKDDLIGPRVKEKLDKWAQMVKPPFDDEIPF